ncbi:serine carboxypeptidase-like 40 [Hevea brasiliensis]|uniref:serine carboxypeptidase-like 40 n=1 Tax=Hevea brasiliensis TaxID=3981 RepID=UPI0025EEB957|nr:serine carboxypeptidase-like 40 [Hevea brasiliensis]
MTLEIEKIHQYHNFSPDFISKQSRECILVTGKADNDTVDLAIYSINWPLCYNGNLTAKPKQASLANFDPCSDYYVYAYFNSPEVQEAMHANVTKLNHDWEACIDVLGGWKDSPPTLIPLPQELMANGLTVGGHSQVYQGYLTFVTLRGSEHEAAAHQPERSLSMIKHFLSGTPLPKGSSFQRPFAVVGLQKCTKL